MYRRRFINPAADKTVDYLFDLTTDQVRSNADNTVTAQSHDGKSIAVITAPDEKIIPSVGDNFSDLFQITAGFFYSCDIIDFA